MVGSWRTYDEHLFSFAHKDAATKDPRGSISQLVDLGCSIETLQKEIELCLLKCATCHNKETKDRRKDWSKVASSPPTVAPPFGNHGGVVSQRRREQIRLAQRRFHEKQREKALEARRQLEERVMTEDEEEESRKRQLALAEGELEGVPEAGEAVARSPSTEEDA
ncbi:USP domain-containing protein [Pseudoscourfieldia marina]